MEGNHGPEERTPYYSPDGRGHGWADAFPAKQGLYDPELEKDSCGVGFTAHIKGKASHKIVTDGKMRCQVML